MYDTTFSNKPDMYEHLHATAPDVVAIYTNLMTKLNVLEIIRFIRNSPELKIPSSSWADRMLPITLTITCVRVPTCW